MSNHPFLFYIPRNKKIVPITKIAVASNSVTIKPIIIKDINHEDKLKRPNLCGRLN